MTRIRHFYYVWTGEPAKSIRFPSLSDVLSHVAYCLRTGIRVKGIERESRMPDEYLLARPKVIYTGETSEQ